MEPRRVGLIKSGKKKKRKGKRKKLGWKRRQDKDTEDEKGYLGEEKRRERTRQRRLYLRREAEGRRTSHRVPREAERKLEISCGKGPNLLHCPL